MRAGLELWRGPPLADFAYEAFAQAPIAQLEELRLGAVEDLIEADLALGRHREVVGELAALVKENPLRERLRAQLMLALYRCGRQAEALDVYQEYRRGLAAELGLDPSPRLQQLEAAILARDPSLELRASGGIDGASADARAGLDAPVLDGRDAGFRTFVLADIRGYSSFAAARGDEAAAALTGRFVVVAERVLGGFGGESLGNRGDEVLFAFESPRHAIRAAVAFEQALLEATREDPTLPLPAGVGLDVGEAVIVSDGWRANAINVAARLCSLAKGGEVLATREVAHLAQAIDGVRFLPRPPVRLKGIPEPVAAVRVVADAADTAQGFAQLGLTQAAAAPVRARERRRLLIAAVALGAAVAAIVGVLAFGGGGSSLAAVAAGSVGAISQSSGTITADVPVGSSLSGVAAGDGAVWVANYSEGTVSRIDLRTRAAEPPIPAGSTPSGIAFGFNAVWAANTFGATVSRIDPAVDSPQPIHVGNGPTGVVIGYRSVWVANSTDGTLSRINPVSDTPTTIRLAGATEASDVAVGEGAVWVSDAPDGRVLRVSPYTNRVTDSINVGNGPTAITVGYRAVWVTNSIDNTVSRIDPRTDKVNGLFQVGDGPNAIVAGAGGVWVANEFGDTVVRINPAANVVAAKIPVGTSPRGLAIAGRLVWVSTQASAKSIPTSGPGLTRPTHPSARKASGGTVYFTDSYGVAPFYIFPMYSFAYCTPNNIDQLINMLYRPLYWYGNNYRPTVDYGYSIGQPPAFSDGDRTVTIKLNSWKWSDGESVTSRDLVFWMNVLKANPSGWCGSAPGYFPDLVTSYSAPNPTTFVLHFKEAYNRDWVLYNVLSQLTPMPLAWDRTSLSRPTPRSDNGHLPDTTKSGAAAVYKLLDAESCIPTPAGSCKNSSRWASSPLWSVVDGPFKLAKFTSTGEVTLVPNPSYSGSPKPTISRLVELPYADAAIFDAVRSGGPTAVTIANIPSEYAAAIPALRAEGYELNLAASYSFNYFPLNFNSSATTSPGGEPVRYVFRQAYFRQALQRLVDQQGWIRAFSYGTANPTCGPIPLSPPSPLVNALSAGPCAFSVAAAQRLLSANGWNVVPGGTTTCVRPGTRSGECGAGIEAREGISFNVDYESDVASVRDEMKDLAARARRVGINLSLTTHPFGSVISAAVPCTLNQSTCRWTAENWGAGWSYGPAYLPTGEQLYGRGAAENAGSYTDPKITRLIQATIASPATQEAQALATYAQYIQQQLPVIFDPTRTGSYAYADDAGTLVANNLAGYAANAFGAMNPEDWYFTR